jgi:beta-glucanase (GH16 family)
VTAEVDAGVKAEVTAGANDVSDTNDASDSDRTGAASSSTGRILAATSDPTSGELPLETAVAPLRPARQGLDAFDSKRRLLVAGAIVAGIGLISAYLLTQESDDGGAETTADTEEAAAEDRRDDEEPATERTTTTNGASGERALDDEQASSIAREIAAAGRLQSSSTTERTTTQASTSVASSPASADGTTPGTGDSAADPNEPGDGSSTTTPSATTPDASSTTESPSSTATPSTTCTGVTWIPVLDEGFNGTTLDSGVWSTGQGSAGQGVQQANAISVANGSLNITAQMLDGTLVSGGVQHRGGQAYGRFEVRVRTDNDASGTMSGQIATAGSGSSHVLYNTGSVSNAASWHTMAVEWTPTSVKYFADGALVRTVEDNIPAAAQTLSLRYDASGSTLPSNVTMQVDHVKISEYGGGC